MSSGHRAIAALLPVKDIEDAKQRLATALSAEQRRDLFRAMLEDVLETLVSSPDIATTYVLTRDPEVRTLAGRYGASLLDESENGGQTRAVSAGAKALLASVPVPNPRARRQERLRVTGDVPSPINPPSGCRFHTRCEHATDVCRARDPALLRTHGDHATACHLVNPP